MFSGIDTANKRYATQMPRQVKGIPLASATATTLGELKMIQKQVQQGLEATADNVLPFPATTATDATGNDEAIKLYTADELKAEFAPTAQTTRTVRDLVGKVRDAYHWLDEVKFKRGDKFTQFTFDQIQAMKNSELTHRQWIAEIQTQAPKQEDEQPITPQPIEAVIEDEPGLDRGILARYERKPQQDQRSTQITPYFNPTDYQSRYTSSEQRLKNQQQKEIGFANELLTKFADFAEDDAAWKQSEAQNSEARQREMAIAGMSEALGDFLQKNTAYRSMMERLEAGEITPELVMEFLKRMQSPKSPVGNGSSVSS
jgi:hypothetical protein